MRINRSAVVIGIALLPFVICRAWWFCRHSAVRLAGGSVRVRWAAESGSRPAIFDNPGAGGFYVFLNAANVNDANIAMLDCYYGFIVLDLSNTNVTSAGLDSLPNLRSRHVEIARGPPR